MLAICVGVAGCKTISGDEPLNVAIPRDCEELARQVAVPEWRSGMKVKPLLAKTTAALETANGNLDATRACQEAQRERFAAGGAAK